MTPIEPVMVAILGHAVRQNMSLHQKHKKKIERFNSSVDKDESTFHDTRDEDFDGKLRARGTKGKFIRSCDTSAKMV